jgi:DNA-binding phage protein
MIDGWGVPRQQAAQRHGDQKQESETQVGESTMALTRDFRDTIRERAQREPAFRQSLLHEGLQLINNGDFARGRAMLRNYIDATIGFSELAREMNIPSPSLQRMFGPSGNPSAQNLFGVIAALQKNEGVSIELRMLSRV